LLDIHNIDVFYGDVHTIKNVTFYVNEGEIVTIVGSNGAGKTTILKTINGLLHPSSGTINFLGKKIDKLSPYNIVEKGISHVMEGRRLFPYMSVLENLELGAYVKKARKNIKENLEFVFNLFPVLEERIEQLAGTLSGGEQQMLAIGRGLMSNPLLLLFDEPSLGLAPVLVQKIFKTIEDVNKKGITVLLVEQNIQNALNLADRAYVLETGEINLEGCGKDLLNNSYIKNAYLGIG